MSRIGKQPIKIERGVDVVLEKNEIVIKGPKGKLELNLPRGITIEKEDENLLILSKSKTKQGKANYGTIRALVSNMMEGVSKGWLKQLELVGAGYKVETDGKKLTLIVGFSHPVIIEAPEGINFKVEKNIVTVEGIDRQLVGQISAEIRSVKPPEPYKGKGIKYIDEIIRRKAGKAARTVGVM